MIYLNKEEYNKLIYNKLSNESLFKEEFLELFKIYNIIHFFIRQIYKENDQPNILIAAQLIFHKYRICSDFSLKKYSPLDLYIILGSCLFIGQQSINILNKKIVNISSIIKQIINKKYPKMNVDINNINKKIIKTEYEILTKIGFNIDIDSPFNFFEILKGYLSKYQIDPTHFNTLLKYIIQDCYILPIPLYYSPNIISISSVIFLKNKYNLKSINIKELISLSNYEIDINEIEACIDLIVKIENAINEKKNKINNNNAINKDNKDKKVNNENRVNSSCSNLSTEDYYNKKISF